tara:strand:+ start:6661 stop:8217 length:1557 start_codon:yes stop_codon:yes gene_type:complete
MKNSIKEVEKGINNIFGNLNQRSWVKVSYLLSKLDLSLIRDQIKIRETFYPVEAFLKLYLYKKLKGINTFYKTLEILERNKEEAFVLGFFEEDGKLILPSKRNINKFFQRKVNGELLFLLDSIVEKILAKATKEKVLLDIEIVKNHVKKKDNRKVMREAVKLVKKLVYPQIDIQIKNNGKFTTKDLLDVLVHVAQTHDFANNGAVTYKELNSNDKSPHGNTLMYHFRKFKYNEQVKDMFENVLDVIFNFAKKNYKELRRRKLDIAIDIHKIPYYGDKNDAYVIEGKHERGTNHFYQFITSSIVVAGRRFTISVLPIHKFDNLEDLVDEIIKKTKSKVSIDKAYLDRGFDKPKVINILKRNRVKFVIPKIRSPTVKAWMRKSVGVKARKIKDFEIGTRDKAVVDLYLVDDEEGIKRAFISNLDIPEQLAHYLYKFYSKRWGIETGYRNMDQDFKPRTNSKNYQIRLFYFLFTVALYNLWVLVNIVVSLALFGRLSEKPVITAKLFSVILYKAVYEDPPT